MTTPLSSRYIPPTPKIPTRILSSTPLSLSDAHAHLSSYLQSTTSSNLWNHTHDAGTTAALRKIELSMRGLHGPAATSSIEQQVEQEAEDAKVAAIALEHAEEHTTITAEQQQQSPYQYPTKRPRRTSFNTSTIDDNEHISLSNPRILPNLDEVTNDDNSEELADVSQQIPSGRQQQQVGGEDQEASGYEQDYNNIPPTADNLAEQQANNVTVIDKEERKRLKKERLKQEKRSKAQANQTRREMDLDESSEVIMKEADLDGGR